MNWVVVALGVLVVVLGALAAARPGSIAAWGNWWKVPSRIYLAGALRLGLGTALWVAAPDTDYVVALRVLADRLEHDEGPRGPVSVTFETSAAA